MLAKSLRRVGSTATPLLAKVDEEEEERMLDARLGTPAQDDADVAMNASSSSDNDDGDK